MEGHNDMNQSHDSNWQRWPVLALATATLFLGALPALRAKSDTDAEAKPAPAQLTVDNKPLNREGSLPRSFAPVVQKVSKSVVQVTTASRPKAMIGMIDPSDPFGFFGGPQRRGPNAPRMPRQEGIGSGVVVSRDGYILTNNHVVEEAEEVKVKFSDGRELSAKVIGRDPGTDVAIIKVAATDLDPATIADSDRLEVGDIVFAVGNPFGIGQTVTMGIISATSRATMNLAYEDFIQTDAAINPGNSGGALVDADGRLIGINSAILSRSGGNVGIGFAIPSNLAKDVLQSLVTDGKVTRGFLGVLPQDITPVLARKLELKESTGAVLTEVTPKSPAAKAGLESGDVVLEFNGKPVRDARHLRLEIARTKPGVSVPMKYRRDGEVNTVKVTLRERPATDELGQNSATTEEQGTLNGVGVGDLSREARQQNKIPATVKGVLVTEVEQDSKSWEAGLRPGDVILEINKEAVRSADEAVKLTEDPKDKTTLLKVWSRGGVKFLVVDETSTK
jgi:serine protease Do